MSTPIHAQEIPVSCATFVLLISIVAFLMTPFYRPTSILTQAHMTSLLAIAQANVEKGHHLLAMLFVQSRGVRGQAVGLPLADLPADAAQRALYFAALGAQLKREIGDIEAAIFLNEAWWTPVAAGQPIGNVTPSQHPDRCEAILLVGRNADNSHHSLLLQPFTRDRLQNPVWSKTRLESYGQPGQLKAVGLLDLLFQANQGKVPHA